MSETLPNKAPLAIEQTAHNNNDGVTSLEVGGISVKLDALGPMIVQSDGTLARISNWQELSQIEKDRTVRLLVKKRNLVRMEKIAAAEGGDGDKVSALTEAQAEKK